MKVQRKTKQLLPLGIMKVWEGSNDIKLNWNLQTCVLELFETSTQDHKAAPWIFSESETQISYINHLGQLIDCVEDEFIFFSHTDGSKPDDNDASEEWERWKKRNRVVKSSHG